MDSKLYLNGNTQLTQLKNKPSTFSIQTFRAKFDLPFHNFRGLVSTINNAKYEINILLPLIFLIPKYSMLCLFKSVFQVTFYVSTHCLVYFSEATHCKYNGELNNFMTVNKNTLLLQISRIFGMKKMVQSVVQLGFWRMGQIITMAVSNTNCEL